MAGRGVTIRDVAAHAGVSLGTASRVLSGHPATSPQARDRVTEAVTALGYRPNVQARSLRLTRTQAIGLLVSDVRNPFFADVAHAAEQAALAADYVTLLGNANENVEQQDRYLETFLNQRVDGVVLAPQGRGSGSLDALIASQMPVVFVDRTVDGFDVPSVTTDSRAGLDEAIAHLVAAGHSRIGYIGGPQSISTGRQRYDDFIEALPRHGIDSRPVADHLRRLPGGKWRARRRATPVGAEPPDSDPRRGQPDGTRCARRDPRARTAARGPMSRSWPSTTSSGSRTSTRRSR